MQFHLDLKPKPSAVKLSHRDGVLMIGSCFTEHIGKRLSHLKFRISSNPFGIVFNPESIAASLQRMIDRNYFTTGDVFEKDGKWYSMDCHSSISAPDQAEILNTLNATIDDWNTKLKTSALLVVTFGSAYAYRYRSSQQIAANCHKLPGNLFDKELLEPELIRTLYSNLLLKLKAFNPGLTVMFTVSPVKHLRDGVVENSLS